jgi:uncharacterized protein (DUF2267 family)
MTVPSTIAHTVQQAQEWPKELRDDGDLDDEPARAEHIARRFASAWRPSCPEEAVGLGAQLPTILMLNLLPRPIAAERAITDLFALGAHHCDPGDISQVIGQVPADIKELWPETARTYRQRLSS